MINLNNFKTQEDHEKILNLEGSDTNSYKVVACIHLEKYEEGLKYCSKNSYEAAYIYYKLRKYKKGLKICNKNSGEKWDVLTSQILFGMGYYNKAYEYLSRLPKDDEIVVNLQAMKSMAILTDKVNKVPGHSLYIKKREDNMMYDNIDNYKFQVSEAYLEFLFNKSFEVADKYDEYLSVLKKLSDQYSNMENNMFRNQVLNIEGSLDELNQDELTKTQKNILNYNMGKTEDIDNSLHFLANYQKDLSDNEYKWIENVKLNNWKTKWNEIPDTTENLLVLRILTGLINKNMKSENIKKFVNRIKKEDIKKKISELLNFNGEGNVGVLNK
jgi:hypothetical protein